jgi:hypothetical protein
MDPEFRFAIAGAYMHMDWLSRVPFIRIKEKSKAPVAKDDRHATPISLWTPLQNGNPNMAAAMRFSS